MKFSQTQLDCIWLVQNTLEKLENLDSDVATDDQDYELVHQVFSLCIALVMQDTSRISLYESPLMHYLAVRGIDKASGSFRLPIHYTGILAGMLWINRLLLLEIAVPLEPWNELELESKDQIECIQTRTNQIRLSHLVEGSYSPTASILTQLAWGKKWNRTHQSRPNIHWSGDFQTIYYLGQGVELGKITALYSTVVRELQELVRELSFGSVNPYIDLKAIQDSMGWSSTFRSTGFSFLSYAKNRNATGLGYDYLLNLARCGKGQWKLFQKDQAQQVQWVDKQTQAYLVRERQFLRKLMVCMHITGM